MVIIPAICTFAGICFLFFKQSSTTVTLSVTIPSRALPCVNRLNASNNGKFKGNTIGFRTNIDLIGRASDGFNAINFAKTHGKVYSELTTDHPIDLTRYQVANCYMGRAGLINSGGASGSNDITDAVSTAIINKRAGGAGLISGRKAFQKPVNEGVALLNAIQDIYLDDKITIA